MANYRINSIKLVDDVPHIAYDVISEKGIKSITLETKDKATQDFTDVWAELLPHFLEMAELPKTWGTPGTKNGESHLPVSVRKVSFKYEGKKETMSVVISAMRELEHDNSPQNISTTPKSVPEVPRDELQGDALLYITAECEDTLTRLIAETIEFINGKRTGADQEEMFASDDDEQPDAMADLDTTTRPVIPNVKILSGGGRTTNAHAAMATVNAANGK